MTARLQLTLSWEKILRTAKYPAAKLQVRINETQKLLKSAQLEVVRPVHKSEAGAQGAASILRGIERREWGL